MKLKNYDWTEPELRLEAADPRLLPDNGVFRAAMLAIAILGAAALAWMAVYLICLSPPFQNDDPGANAMRTWRSIP